MRLSKALSLLLIMALSISLVIPSPTQSYAAEEGWSLISAADCVTGSSLMSGKYILTEALNLADAIVIPEGEKVFIDLAGFDITMNSEIAESAIVNCGTLILMDSAAVVTDDKYESCGFVSGVKVSGINAEVASFAMLGGALQDVLLDGAAEVIVTSGLLSFDPRSVNALADCSCMRLDAETGLYTVTHKTDVPCTLCTSYVPYEVFTYALTGNHTYDNATVCKTCQVVTAKIGDTSYTELETALNASAPDTTVILQRDVKVSCLDLYTTLDINGNNIVSLGIVDAANADANIVDTVGNGSVSGSYIKMYKDNEQIAVDADNNNVYTFEAIPLKQKIEFLDSGTASVKFYVDKAADDTKLDDSIKAGANVKICITVSWMEAGAKKSHSFVYRQSLVDVYVNGWGSKIFTCTISGLEELGDCTIAANIISCGVAVSGDAVRRLLTWREYLALSSAEQRAYKESFENRNDYYKWMQEAREAYDKEQETEMDGNIDIGDILKP